MTDITNKDVISSWANAPKEDAARHGDEGYAYTFHRPLSSYLNLVIEAGCVVQRVIEPQLDKAVVQQYGIEHARNAYVPQFLIVATTKSMS